MINQNFVVKFDGDLAADHRLPAYQAAESLAGVARSLIIPMQYLASGKVRYRNISDQNYKLELLTVQPGSFEFIFNLLSSPEFMWGASFFKDIAVDVAAYFICDFIKSIINRAIGEEASEKIVSMEEEGRLSSGDMGALVDAVTPSLIKGHATIGDGATVINIIGNGNTIVLNQKSKRYLSTSIANNNVFVKNFSVGTFNANQGTGRAFDFDLRKTIPFLVDKGADAEKHISQF